MKSYEDEIKSALILACEVNIPCDEELKETVEVIKKLNVSYINEAFVSSLEKSLGKDNLNKAQEFLDSDLYYSYNLAMSKAALTVRNDIQALVNCLCSSNKETSH